MVNAVVTEQQEVTKTVIVPVTTETTTRSEVNTTTDSAVTTEVTMLSRVNTTSRSTASTVTLTQATQSGTPYDTSIYENTLKTENDGVAEPGEYYYVEVPVEVESEMIDFVEVTVLTDGIETISTTYEVDAVVEVTVDTPVETTNIEDVGVSVSQTAPAP